MAIILKPTSEANVVPTINAVGATLRGAIAGGSTGEFKTEVNGSSQITSVTNFVTQGAASYFLTISTFGAIFNRGIIP